MECNKEEALRAKSIAEEKMQAKDFPGAKRTALKAQRLYPDLENITQLLTVCEVHCSAATKVNGTEDWYGILQVETTADEVSIKKQYRKLALLLHPDKNNFPGAESAFKLIGEAHRTLSDHSKRSIYDSKRLPIKVPGVQPAVSNAFHGAQQQQSPPTFWTFCPFCKIRYQYYRTIMNRPIRCQTCLRTFVAYDLSVNTPVNPSPGGTSKQPGFAQQNGFSSQSTFKTKVNQFGSVPSSTGFHGNAGVRTGNKTAEEKQAPSDPRKKTEVRFEEVKLEKKADKPSTNQKQKRSRENAARGSTCNGNDSSDSEIEIVAKQSNGFTQNNKDQRRSNRTKTNVQYADDQSDYNGLGSPHKKSRDGKSPHDLKEHDSSVGRTKVPKEEKSAGIAREKPPQHATETEKSRPQVGSGENKESGSAKMNPAVLPYPDSEFHDFYLDRNVSSFKEGQIWALYDDQDGMPRFYAKIIKVSSPRFIARYTWLEYLPEGQTAKSWYKANFPVACGNFRLGKSETTTEIRMFSHLMSWEKGAKKNTFFIKPRKGEVWALYRSWSIDWICHPEKHQTYEYDVVEVLSDDDAEGGGVSVVALLKVNGFVSIFTRAVKGSVIQIPPGELVRFSHLIPSCGITTSEIQGIPEGSYELDPGSLPCDSEQKFASVTLEVKKVKSDDPAVKVDEKKDASEANSLKSETEPMISATNSNSEDKTFHDFQSEKTLNKFKSGQIWALYSDFDTFPKYYALITSINDSLPEVHVTWLDCCPESEDEKKWFDKDLPLSTGKFRLSYGKEGKEVFDTVQAFSHLVAIQETGKKNHYCIYPQNGQVWALYRNWSINWEASDLKSCEYDIAEILSINVSKVKVMFLTKVEGYDTVYKQERKGVMPVISEIPRTEMFRFSHQIPSHRLKGENKGSLHGYYELDSESLPGTE